MTTTARAFVQAWPGARCAGSVRGRTQKETAFMAEIASGALTLDLYRLRHLGRPADWPGEEES